MTRAVCGVFQLRSNTSIPRLFVLIPALMVHMLVSHALRIGTATAALGRSPSTIGCRLGNQLRRNTFGSDKVRSETKCAMTIADTALGNTVAGKTLLDGLDVYTVPASGDNHPLAVYGIESEDPSKIRTDSHDVRPILLLHGRTWSSVPVYHLLGGPTQRQNGKESRSLMEALLANGLQPYAMDFRGFGGTPLDATRCVEPFRCVADVETVLKWIAQRHGMDGSSKGLVFDMPALLGWSQGALVAQMVAQKTHHLLSKLVLYGSLYDPLVRYVRDPLYTMSPATNESPIINTADAAMEDFTIEGTITQETAVAFAEAALVSDPHKANWKHLYQFNTLDPARVHVPTLVVAGDQDPYAPLHVQADLFTNLGRGSDRTWSILADADHAAHMLDGRGRFCNIVTSFVQNGKRSEKSNFF